MRRAFVTTALVALTFACGSFSDRASLSSETAALSSYTDKLDWSRRPPGLDPVDTPQFVAVTFDDNFVSGLGDVSGGMTWVTTFFKSLVNPAGSGFAPTFDGAPVRTSFYDNCVYLPEDSTKMSWRTARMDGHEIANHTVNHPHGGAFTTQNWSDEIVPCTAALTNPDSGVGVTVDDVRGFRAPYLEYSPDLFGVLKTQGLWYDTSIQSCWAATDDGKSCAWPYTLDQGSPDGVEITTRFAVPSVPPTSGLWEMTPSVLFVPPDELAAEYGFERGLRQRVPPDMPAPSFYDVATGRIAPLDVTLFVDAHLSAAEVLATLKYTLDLRLAGNRAPFIFISHSHVYASNYSAAPKAPTAAERQGAIEAFIRYALGKPVVRMRPVADILDWMRHPMPLNGTITVVASASGGAADAGGVFGAAGIGGGALSGGGGVAGSSSSFGGGGSVQKTPVGKDGSEASTRGCACNAAGSVPARAWLLLGVGAVLLRRRSRRQHLA